MKLIISVVLLVSLSIFIVHTQDITKSLNTKLDSIWELYKEKFDKKYDENLELNRRSIFEENVDIIQHHNLQYNLGKRSYYMGLNEHSDLTKEEFQTKFLNSINPVEALKKKSNTEIFKSSVKQELIPKSVDWREKGYVTPVKRQGSCGACYAFAAIGSLEGQYFKKTGKLLSFSEQQIVDCSQSYYNNGCKGGMMSRAYKYIARYGIQQEDEYPYVVKEETCKYNSSQAIHNVKTYVSIPANDEAALAEATASVGPISVCIHATAEYIQHYMGGIFDEPNCSKNINHGVLVVGYGEENGKKYWIVKNSWGLRWGEDGYVRMSKDKDNQCAIASVADFPVV